MTKLSTCSVCISENGYKKWLPASINAYEGVLEKLINTTCNVHPFRNIRKNLAYQLQYLEYVNHSLENSQLTEVLKTQNLKSFTIFGASSIEGILYCVVRKANKQSQIHYKEIERTHSNDHNLKKLTGVTKIRMITIVEEKLLTPADQTMTFDGLIKIATSNKLLGNTFTYKDLDEARKLRNKVHIHVIDDITSMMDTDYFNFSDRKFKSLKKSIYDTIKASTGSTKADMTPFEWLN